MAVHPSILSTHITDQNGHKRRGKDEALCLYKQFEFNSQKTVFHFNFPPPSGSCGRLLLFFSYASWHQLQGWVGELEMNGSSFGLFVLSPHHHRLRLYLDPRTDIPTRESSNVFSCFVAPFPGRFPGDLRLFHSG